MKEHLESKNATKLDANGLLSCIKWYKEYQLANDYEGDADEYLDAFVALGGENDKTGTIHKNTLIEIIKIEFELTIDMVVSNFIHSHHGHGETLGVLSGLFWLTSHNSSPPIRNTCKRSVVRARKSTTTNSVSCLTLEPQETHLVLAVTFQTTRDRPSWDSPTSWITWTNFSSESWQQTMDVEFAFRVKL